MLFSLVVVVVAFCLAAVVVFYLALVVVVSTSCSRAGAGALRIVYGGCVAGETVLIPCWPTESLSPGR